MSLNGNLRIKTSGKRPASRSNSIYFWGLLSQALSMLWMIYHLIFDLQTGSSMFGLPGWVSIIFRVAIINLNGYLLVRLSREWSGKNF